MSLTGTVWAPIGPSPMNEGGSGGDNGLVTAIAVNPNNPSVIYLGSALGGVWRSDDTGNTWTPIFDHQTALGIGEPGGVAIDPSNTSTIYVGTSGVDSTREPEHDPAACGGLIQIYRRRCKLDCGRLGIPSLEHRQRRQSVQLPSHQRHHRRSRQQQRRLPRRAERCVYLGRRRAELDPGGRHFRQRSILGAGSHDAGGCAHPVCGCRQQRRLQLHGRRADIQSDTQRNHARGERPHWPAAPSLELSWRLHRRPHRPTSMACR